MMKLACVLVLAMVGAVGPGASGQEVEKDHREVFGQDPVLIMRGNHPRGKGMWPQYWGLETSLRGHVTISDVITPETPFGLATGKPAKKHDASAETADNYASSHNHYQNFLSEVWNFAPNVNAVGIWGDSAAYVKDAKAWGGFFSARSDQRVFTDSPEMAKFLPPGTDQKAGPEFDAQLIGVEIDVLNDGKPGVFPNASKTALQLVGFGNPNSMAIEVRCEDTDREVAQRKGVFEAILYVKNSIADYGRMIVSDFEKAKMGLDFRRTLFTEGAAQLRTEGVGTGVIFNQHKAGEIYGGLRWPGFADTRQFLSVRMGEGGFRVASNDNTKEPLAIDSNGGIYLRGDVYVNDERIDFGGIRAAIARRSAPKWPAPVAAVSLGLVLVLMVQLGRTQAKVAELTRLMAAKK